LWQALQGVGAIVGGAVRAPFPEQVSSLPNAAARSNTTLIFDNLGQPTVAPLSGLSVVIGDMSATVVQGDGVTDNAAQITAANALGKPIYFQGVSNPATPVTITVPIRNGLQQIFTPISQVTIDNGLPVRQFAAVCRWRDGAACQQDVPPELQHRYRGHAQQPWGHPGRGLHGAQAHPLRGRPPSRVQRG
jgi:hypothetical protein